MRSGKFIIAGTLLLSCFVFTIVFNNSAEKNPAETEPAIGAGHGHGHGYHNNIISEPIHFGAIVGGDSGIYIELDTDGSVLTNSQSPHSYIGDFNKQKFAGSSRYLIQPGRLKLDFNVSRAHSHLLVEFSPNTNLAGVTLPRVNIETTDIDNAVLVGNYNVPNEVKFEIQHPPCHRLFCGWFFSHNKTKVVVDMSLYGRLAMETHISGDVDAQIEATIKLRK